MDPRDKDTGKRNEGPTDEDRSLTRRMDRQPAFSPPRHEEGADDGGGRQDRDD